MWVYGMNQVALGFLSMTPRDGPHREPWSIPYMPGTERACLRLRQPRLMRRFYQRWRLVMMQAPFLSGSSTIWLRGRAGSSTHRSLLLLRLLIGNTGELKELHL